MKIALILLISIIACGPHNSVPLDSSTKILDANIVTIDSRVIDSLVDSTIIPLDGNTTDSAIRDSAVTDAGIDAPTDSTVDAGNTICNSGVTINGKTAIVGTVVTCPRNQSVNIQNEVYDTNGVLQEAFLQNGIGCGNPAGLRVTESKPISRVDVSFTVVETGEFGDCLQN